MRVSYVGNRLDFQTGIFIKKESWDNVQQRVLPINSSIAIANDLNDHLFKMLSDMVIVFREFELRQIIPSPKELREKFQKQSAPQGRPMAESTENGGTINVQQIDNYPPKLKKNEFWKNFDEFVKVNGNSMIGLLQHLKSLLLFAIIYQSLIRNSALISSMRME